MKEKIMVLGAGAWGTSIANLLALNLKKKITIWAHEKAVANEINKDRKNNSFLANIKLSKNICCTNSYTGKFAEYVFVVVPSQHVFTIVKDYLKSLPKTHHKKISIVLCSKGFDLKRKKLLSDMIGAHISQSQIAILSGPSFAMLVAKKKPSAISLASQNIRLANKIRDLLSNNYFRVYLNKDIIGVQVNGALKNVLAIAAGMTDGLGFGENARAAIISRGLLEIEKVSVSLGGKKRSIMGLSGVGDILLTCTSSSSRNYYFGQKIGQGFAVRDIIKNKSTVTEGIENCKAVYFIKKNIEADTPILDAVYKVVVRNYPIKKIVKDLLSRPLKVES